MSMKIGVPRISNPSPNLIKHFINTCSSIAPSSNQRRRRFSLRTYAHIKESCIVSVLLSHSSFPFPIRSVRVRLIERDVRAARRNCPLAEGVLMLLLLLLKQDGCARRRAGRRRELRQCRGGGRGWRWGDARISLPCVSPCRQTKHGNASLK